MGLRRTCTWKLRCVPDAKTKQGDQGKFALDRPIRSFRHLHFRQSFRGWRLQNEILAAHGRTPVGYWGFLSPRLPRSPRLQLAGSRPATWFVDCVQQLPYQRGAMHSRDPLGADHTIRAVDRSPLRLVLPQFAVAGVSFFCFCCRLRCMSSSALLPITKTARSRASRRSPSRHFCFPPNSGRRPCKPGRRNIW